MKSVDMEKLNTGSEEGESDYLLEEVDTNTIQGCLPIEVDKTVTRDLDGCRMLFLSCFNNECDAVPKYLQGTFAPPSGTSHKVAAYSTVVFCAISVPTVLASLYNVLWPCVTDTELDSITCSWRNTTIPNSLLALGSIVANIGGLLIYDHRNNLFEGLRNQAQDSAKQLEDIYLKIAKFTLRTYVKNLILAKEYARQNNQTISLKKMGSKNFVKGLDVYLNNAPVKFKNIHSFINKIDEIKINLKDNQVAQATIQEIIAPFEQIRELLLADTKEGQMALNALHVLVFEDQEYPHSMSRAIYEVITDQHLTGVIDNLTNARTVQFLQHISNNKDKKATQTEAKE